MDWNIPIQSEDWGLTRNTGVCSSDGLAIPQVVQLVDAIDEDHARLSHFVGGADDLVPQITRLDGPEDSGDTVPVRELQVPVVAPANRVHEVVGDQDGQVEHAKTGSVLLGGDEVLDVGVIATHGCHHGAATFARAHDRPAHGVPYVHEAQRPRRIGGNTFHLGTFRTDRGEVVADPATLLHGQSGFTEHGENAVHAVRNGAHDIAVEESDRTAGPSAGGDAAGRKELVVFQGIEEILGMRRGVKLFRFSQSAGDTKPSVLDSFVKRRAVRHLKAIFLVPNLGRNFRVFHEVPR